MKTVKVVFELTEQQIRAMLLISNDNIETSRFLNNHPQRGMFILQEGAVENPLNFDCYRILEEALVDAEAGHTVSDFEVLDADDYGADGLPPRWSAITMIV